MLQEINRKVEEAAKKVQEIDQKTAKSNQTLVRTVEDNWDQTLRMQNGTRAEIKRVAQAMTQNIADKFNELSVVTSSNQAQPPLPASPLDDNDPSSDPRESPSPPPSGDAGSSGAPPPPQERVSRNVKLYRRQFQEEEGNGVELRRLGKRGAREDAEDNEEEERSGKRVGSLFHTSKNLLFNIPVIGDGFKLACFLATGSTLEEKEEEGGGK